MSKFKQGDEVYWEGYEGEKHFRVVSKVEDHKIWFTNGYWEQEGNLFFVDELLPEPPTGVRYECNQKPGQDFLEVENFDGHLIISVQENGKQTHIKLTAGSALELSADILRMGLQIKRDSEENHD